MLPSISEKKFFSTSIYVNQPMNNSTNSLEAKSNFPSVPWTPGDVGWGLGVFGLWLCSFIVISLLVDLLKLSIDPGLVIIFGEVVLLLPVWYFTFHKYGTSWVDLGLRGFRLQAVRLGFGLMIVFFGLNLVYASLLSLFNLQVQPDITLVFKKTNFPLVLLLGGAIIAPIVEEIFFRGFVFTGLRSRWNWRKATLVSAGLFALAHVLPTSLLPIFVLGLIFAFLYQSSGSIWPAILMHMLTNSLALSIAYAVSQGWIPAP
jgi:membrane protease YdiL (CAAX protease family)